MQVESRPSADIRPYPNNPRQNDDAVEAVARSIREFGFRQPIVVDADLVVICGHTRLKAAQRLGLTEVPIVQGLRASGMGEGPSLALLLAGPALSLPNMLAIRAIMGTQKTAVYVALVVVMATIAGLVYGAYIAL